MCVAPVLQRVDDYKAMRISERLAAVHVTLLPHTLRINKMG